MSADLTPYYAGLDPGKTGALVVLDAEGRPVHVRHAPSSWHREPGPLHIRIAIVVAEVKMSLPSARLMVAVEVQQSRTGQAHQAAIVAEDGIWRGALAMAGADVYPVTPQTWRAHTGTSMASRAACKRASVDYCRARIPELDLTPGRTRTPQDGIADAGVIADWLRRRMI